jgi:hypothetical protein
MDCFFLKCGCSCVCILGTKPDKFGSKLRTSSGQVPDKFRTSSAQVPDKFRFSNLSVSCPKIKLVREIVRFYIGICGFCTGQVRVVQKPNLSANCLELSAVGQLSDKFLANGQVSSYDSCVRMCSRAAHHTPQPTTIIPHSPHFRHAIQGNQTWGHTSSRLGHAPPCQL